MKVEFENFTVTEAKDGELTVTVKSGFSIRLVAAKLANGFHIHGPKPGDKIEVWTSPNVSSIRKPTGVSIYKIPERVSK